MVVLKVVVMTLYDDTADDKVSMITTSVFNDVCKRGYLLASDSRCPGQFADMSLVLGNLHDQIKTVVNPLEPSDTYAS